MVNYNNYNLYFILNDIIKQKNETQTNSYLFNFFSV